MEYYTVVDKKIIPRQTRESKYAGLVEKANSLSQTDAIQIADSDEISLTSIMSLMRKKGFNVQMRTIDKVKNLFITKTTPKTEEQKKPKK